MMSRKEVWLVEEEEKEPYLLLLGDTIFGIGNSMTKCLLVFLMLHEGLLMRMIIKLSFCL